MSETHQFVVSIEVYSFHRCRNQQIIRVYTISRWQKVTQTAKSSVEQRKESEEIRWRGSGMKRCRLQGREKGFQATAEDVGTKHLTVYGKLKRLAKAAVAWAKGAEMVGLDATPEPLTLDRGSALFGASSRCATTRLI